MFQLLHKYEEYSKIIKLADHKLEQSQKPRIVSVLVLGSGSGQEVN